MNKTEIRNKYNFNSNFIFSDLSSEEMGEVRNMFEPINFRKGSQLFYEEGVPTGIFFIKRGLVKKYKTLKSGQQQIFYIYTNNDLIGYHALLSERRYQDSCDAIEDTETNFISKENFTLLMKTIPSLKNRLLQNLAHEFGVLANTMTILAQTKQNVRLALFLLILELRYEKYNHGNTFITLPRLDLANLIGITRESLGRSLKEFKDNGYISIESKAIQITNREALNEMLD